MFFPSTIFPRGSSFPQVAASNSTATHVSLTQHSCKLPAPLPAPHHLLERDHGDPPEASITLKGAGEDGTFPFYHPTTRWGASPGSSSKEGEITPPAFAPWEFLKLIFITNGLFHSPPHFWKNWIRGPGFAGIFWAFLQGYHLGFT